MRKACITITIILLIITDVFAAEESKSLAVSTIVPVDYGVGSILHWRLLVETGTTSRQTTPQSIPASLRTILMEWSFSSCSMEILRPHTR